MQLTLRNIEELPDAARALVAFAGNQKFFVFEGEMGVGKTTFIKAFCATLGVDEVVSSPTFSIVNEYETSDGNRIFHFDFYRLKNISEAYDIGYEDYFYSGNYCLVEWPQKVEDILPEFYIRVNITINTDDSRQICFQKIG